MQGLDFGFLEFFGSVISFALANDYQILVFGRLPERPKGADCKSAGTAYGGSNPSSATLIKIPDVTESHREFFFNAIVIATTKQGEIIRRE